MRSTGLLFDDPVDRVKMIYIYEKEQLCALKPTPVGRFERRLLRRGMVDVALTLKKPLLGYIDPYNRPKKPTRKDNHCSEINLNGC